MTWTHGKDMDSWYRHGLNLQTWTHGTDMDSWYRHGLMVYTWTHAIDNTNDIDLDSWYRIVNPKHTRTRGPSVARMQDFFWL